MTASEVLRKARALIEKPENWTQGALSRSPDGEVCLPEEREAVCFCSLGAIERVCVTGEQPLAHTPAVGYLKAALLARGESLQAPIANFNDTHTHAEVLSLFDRAIAAAEARGE